MNTSSERSVKVPISFPCPSPSLFARSPPFQHLSTQHSYPFNMAPPIYFRLLATLFIFTSLSRTISAANCFQGPPWEYYDTLYTDAWNVRSTLCSNSNSVSCRTDSAMTICEFISGNVRGGYAAPTQAEGLSYCWVSFRPLHLSLQRCYVSFC
jgi:hypothetical protein